VSYFENWMRQQGLSESSIKKYEGAITGVMTQWAIENEIIAGSLSDIMTAMDFDAVAIQISALPIFKDRNTTGHGMYNAALVKYSEYLAASPSNTIESDIDAIVDSKVLDITEKASLIKTRIGQGIFRGKLINYWKACSVTKFPDVNLLVASHIKPWSVSTNAERTDVYNGLLLLPNLDRAFDLGYISFDEKGSIVVSDALKNPELLGISSDMEITLEMEHQKYVEYHREYVFEKWCKFTG